MPSISRIYLIIGAVVIAAVVVLVFRYHWVDLGETKANNKVYANQDKLMTKVRKANAKIDRETPFNSGKPAAINWLSGYTTAP